MTTEKIIRITSCDDCPHASIWFEATPEVYTLHCSKALKTENVAGYQIPVWCPLESVDSKPVEKGGFFIPGFLRRQAG